MSQQYPQAPNNPQQPGPHHPAGQMAPPPGYVLKKKTHRFRNFVVFPFFGFIALIVVVVVASNSGGGGGSATTAGETKTTAPAGRNEPYAVTPGKAFQVPGTKHRIDAGWKINYQQYIGSQLVGSVTNVSTDTSTAFFSVKFLKGNKVLANFQCNTAELEPNQTEHIECYNEVTTTQRLTGWDKVTAEATL
ncbi:hypothetical protein EV645_1708 [Kribbella rubisoli]|uniref:Uncharacterized protein n=1 Tax=Kribbella rubisoli TaxID=3075929 RepID=A0A4Q7X8S1_9ACTN|nr:hypothetical protein [Kribbella rubisoli]RZU19497.1 hypothetical protein EV645_1708 [Kribbella rubisoli]